MLFILVIGDLFLYCNMNSKKLVFLVHAFEISWSVLILYLPCVTSICLDILNILLPLSNLFYYISLTFPWPGGTYPRTSI